MGPGPSLGGRSRQALADWLSPLAVIPGDDAVAVVWGRLSAAAHQRGRPRPTNEMWIAACCLVHDLPLATLNVKDYLDSVEHDGLRLITASGTSALSPPEQAATTPGDVPRVQATHQHAGEHHGGERRSAQCPRLGCRVVVPPLGVESTAGPRIGSACDSRATSHGLGRHVGGADREHGAAPGRAPGTGLGSGERHGRATDRAAARAGHGGLGGGRLTRGGVADAAGSGMRQFEQARTAPPTVCTAAVENGDLVERPVRMTARDTAAAATDAGHAQFADRRAGGVAGPGREPARTVRAGRAGHSVPACAAERRSRSRSGTCGMPRPGR